VWGTLLQALEKSIIGTYMEQNDSLNFFMRFIQERHDEFKNNVRTLFSVLVTENKDKKVELNNIALDSSENLIRSISQADCPEWLRQISSRLKWFKENHNRHKEANKILLDTLIKYNQELESHKWSFGDKTTDGSFNFDDIYERFKSDSKLPELFDALISTLEKMIVSNEIDSLRTLTSLKQLLSLLRQNKNGSYFSVMASWEFIGGFLKNVMWESLDQIAPVKVLKDSFEKTVSEMDIELESVHDSIAAEMKSKYNTAVSSLTYKRQSENILEDQTEEV